MSQDLPTTLVAILYTLVGYVPTILAGGLGLLCLYGVVRGVLYGCERGDPDGYAAFAERCYATRTLLHFWLARAAYWTIFGVACVALSVLLVCIIAAFLRMSNETDGLYVTPFGDIDSLPLTWSIWIPTLALMCVQAVMIRRIPLDIHHYGQAVIERAQLAKIARVTARRARIEHWHAADAAALAAEQKHAADRAFAKKELEAQKETQRNMFAVIRQSSLLATRTDSTLTLPSSTPSVSAASAPNTTSQPQIKVTGYVRSAPFPDTVTTVAALPVAPIQPPRTDLHAERIAAEQERQQAEAEMRAAEERHRQQQARETARQEQIVRRRAELEAITFPLLPNSCRVVADTTHATCLPQPLRSTDTLEGELG